MKNRDKAKCYICGNVITLRGKYLQTHGPKENRCSGSYWLYDDMLDVEREKAAQQTLAPDAVPAENVAQ